MGGERGHRLVAGRWDIEKGLAALGGVFLHGVGFTRREHVTVKAEKKLGV
jgi:hypothetical protein